MVCGELVSMDRRFLKMEKDISELSKGQSELKVDVAVIKAEVTNMIDMVKTYMERKDETDKDQYKKIEHLEIDKANASDISRLTETIKWAVGLTITVILPAVATIIHYLI